MVDVRGEGGGGRRRRRRRSGYSPKNKNQTFAIDYGAADFDLGTSL